MYNKCCVVSCSSRRKDVTFYRFPNSEIRLKKWLEYINSEELRSISFQDLCRHFVCQRHFEKRFFASTHVARVRSRLRVGAYPTLFSDIEISSGVPQNANIVDNSNNVDTEHDYSKKRHHEDHCYCKVEIVEKRSKIEMVSDVKPSTPRQPLHDVVNVVPYNLASTSGRREKPAENLYSKVDVVENRPRFDMVADVNSSTPRQPLHDIVNNLPSTSGRREKPAENPYSKVEVVENHPRFDMVSDNKSSTPRQALHDVEELPPTSERREKSTEKPYSLVEVVENHPRFDMVSDNKSSTPRQALHDVENVVPYNLPSISGRREKLAGKKVSRAAESAPKLMIRRTRVILKKKELSSCCAALYREYVKSKKQLEFSKRARRAMKFSREKCFEKLTNNNMNPLAKRFLWMQVKQCTYQAKGRRYTQEEKLIALSIMKQSPKCYRFLHKLFILPSKNTLNRMISELNVEAGVNTQIFEAVKQEVVTWDENKKYCSILFDEVALEAAVTYDKHKDFINGFVELTQRSNDFADHALVFMIRGAICKWEQPFAFYFCKGATSGVQLKKIIIDVVAAVTNTGLLPVALISDQGTAFQSALKGLQEVTRREQILAGGEIDDVITINGHTLSVIFDPPHLIKGLRNNFLTKNIKYDGKVSDIVDVYKTDCNHTHVRLMHKLSDEHVIPEKIKKMKVKNCVKVFSKTVAATLSYTAQFSRYADGNAVSDTLKNTAEMVSFFDDLFDSVNGASVYHKNNKGKPLRHAVTEKSMNHTFWKDAEKKIEKIKFVDSKGKETTVPTLKNWIVTLKSFQRLWQFFQAKGIKVMRPRYLNSDPIENFFGQVRAYNFRNNDPNCHTFKSTFRSLLFTRFIKFHSDSYNCEDDSGEQLLKIKSLFEAHKNVSENFENDCSSESSDFKTTEDENIRKTASQESVQTTASQERLNIHSRAYTTGWVLRKILSHINCSKCEANLTSDEENIGKNSTNNFISFREFKSLKAKKLTYPSEHAVRFFGYINIFANSYLECNPQRTNIVKYLKNEIKTKYQCHFLDCEQHKNTILDSFLNISLRLSVFNWCNIINKILKGTDLIRLNKSLPFMQQKAYDKYKTKLRNKKLNK